MRAMIPLLLASVATTASWAGDSMIDRRLRESVSIMGENPVPNTPNPVERGVKQLLTDGAMEGQEAEVAKAFAEAFALLGRPQAVEEIATRLYGSRSEIAYFVIPCVRGAAFVRVTSVKRGDNQRVVGSLTVAVRPELVLPPDLLAPDPNARH
jgi:hypothetical protein